jgi:hypothetical protein
MAFDTDEATVYQVRPRHRHQEVQKVVPADYQGVMVTDRSRSYEAHSFRRVKQQKYLAHLQKTLSTLGRTSKCYFRWPWSCGGSTTTAQGVALCLKLPATGAALRDRDNQHLLKVLRRCHQRGEILRFLDKP